jgi:hypothetical protein
MEAVGSTSCQRPLSFLGLSLRGGAFTLYFGCNFLEILYGLALRIYFMGFFGAVEVEAAVAVCGCCVMRCPLKTGGTLLSLLLL